MSNTTSLLAYSELITEIHRLSSEKKTGTIFVTSDNGELARIVLNEGRITYLVFGTKHRGYDAIPLIYSIKFGRFQFAEGVFETAQEVPLPNTDNIFQMFGEKRTVETGITVPCSQTYYDLHEIAIQIKKALAIYIGPFAAIVCDEYIDKIGEIKVVDDVLAMIDAVASEIGDPAKEQAFKEDIKKKMLK